MEFEHLDMPIKRHLITSWCVGCRYFNGVQSGNCSAYPNGIPKRYADAYSGTMPDKHDSVQDDQIGEYTFINVNFLYKNGSLLCFQSFSCVWSFSK